jgi:hypothetical protein
VESVSFKQVVERDITDVFFNLDEFSDIHSVGGKDIPAMIDDMENIEREKKFNSHMDGIYARQILLYVKASDFGGLPSQGSILVLDGKRYVIVDTVDEGGVYTITLEANRSR